jgi:acetyl-CoA acyltransferase
MSRVALGSSASVSGLPFGETVLARYADELSAAGTPVFNQGVGAELIADKWGFSRTELDEFALESHALAAAATDEGRFADEIVPVSLPDVEHPVTVDEGIRRGGSLQALAGLNTPFRADGRITAASSSQISDGAAALLMTTSEAAAALGLTPMARIHTTVAVGSDPVMMLTGPIPATAKVLDRAGLRVGEIDAFEVNEAFASVPLAWLAETGADRKALNVNGGAIALGHPLGASGARLATTLLHHMRDSGGRYGLQTMCEGGGMANATVFEALG